MSSNSEITNQIKKMLNSRYKGINAITNVRFIRDSDGDADVIVEKGDMFEKFLYYNGKKKLEKMTRPRFLNKSDTDNIETIITIFSKKGGKNKTKKNKKSKKSHKKYTRKH